MSCALVILAAARREGIERSGQRGLGMLVAALGGFRYQDAQLMML
jgi:hypothetical protein